MPSSLADPVAEGVAVGRGAAGFGGDQAQPAGIAHHHLVAAHGERRHRPLDRGLADPA